MDGKKALAYADMRYKDPQGDYGRQSRQRAILMAIIHKSGSISTLLNQQFINSLASQTQTDLTFDDLTVIAKDYRAATKDVKQTHLQGTGKTLNKQSMEVMKKAELQRVTNFIRNGLSISYKKTGKIALSSAFETKEKASSESSTETYTGSSATGSSEYNYGY